MVGGGFKGAGGGSPHDGDGEGAQGLAPGLSTPGQSGVRVGEPRVVPAGPTGRAPIRQIEPSKPGWEG